MATAVSSVWSESDLKKKAPCIDCFAERRPNDTHRRCNSCHAKWRKLHEPNFAEKQRERERRYKERHPERWKMIHTTAERKYDKRRTAKEHMVEIHCSRCGLIDIDTICRYCRMEKAGIGFMDFNAFA